MQIIRDTERYNARRYGLPWIAKITLKDGELKFHFGSWYGDPGERGMLSLHGIEPGDYYAVGQVDHRSANYAPEYYHLRKDGSGTSITKAEVYKALTTRL
jgi:hypothetical protein